MGKGPKGATRDRVVDNKELMDLMAPGKRIGSTTARRPQRHNGAGWIRHGHGWEMFVLEIEGFV